MMTLAILVFCFSSFWMFYIYLGYPLLIELLWRVRGRQPSSRSSSENLLRSVTLLIAAYNEEDWISEKLRNSLNLDYPASKLDIVVVADGSTDRTPEIVSELENDQIRLLFESERRGKMAALSRAFPYCRGEVLLLSDANCMLRGDALQRLVRHFSNPEVGLVSGKKTVGGDESEIGASEKSYWLYESWIRMKETLLGSTVGTVGEILAIRKDLFVTPEQPVIHDDLYLTVQVLGRGYRVLFEPEAVSTEEATESHRSEWIRRTRMAEGYLQAWKWTPELFDRKVLLAQLISHKLLRSFLPLFAVAIFVANLFVVALSSGIPIFWGGVLAAQLIFYGLALLGGLLHHLHFRSRLLALPTFLTVSHLAYLAGLLRFLLGRSEQGWKKARSSKTPTRRKTGFTLLLAGLLVSLVAAIQPLQGQGYGDERDREFDQRSDASQELTDSQNRLEVAYFTLYRDNVFQARGGAPQTSVLVHTLSLDGEIDLLRRESSNVSGYLAVRQNLTDGLEDADSTEFDLGVRYRRGIHQARIEFFATPRRLAFVSGGTSVSSGVDGVAIGYEVRPGSRWRGRLDYELSREKFKNSDFQDRDSLRHALDADLRYEVHPLFRPGLGIEMARRSAKSSNYERSELTPVIFVQSRLGYRAWVTARYRFRSRDYEVKGRQLSNFARRDRRHDFTAYVNVKLTDTWWLFSYGSFEDQQSTRRGRSFEAFDLGIGVSFRW